MSRLPRDTKGLKILSAVTVRNGVGHIGQCLRRLAGWNRRNDLVSQRVDRRNSIIIFQSHIYTRSITTWPNPVRQIAHRDGSYLMEIISAERLHDIKPAHCDIGKLPARIADKVYVIGDRPSVQNLQ